MSLYLEISLYSIVFIAGILFDRFFLLRFRLVQDSGAAVNLNDFVRVTILLSVFAPALAALIDEQFFDGIEPNTMLLIAGFFAFGSLINEREFFKELLRGIFNRNNNGPTKNS